AYYYFIKPPDYNKLKAILAKAVEQRRLKSEIADLRVQLESTYRFSNIIGKSMNMEKIFKTVEAIKDSSSNVLILGETGTGKELLARAIHYTSRRHYKPFIAVNCAAIPRELLEAEFFGYEKGSFTGAVTRRTGKFEEASTGTLFLDEIGELELPLQAKILRAIQEKEIERIGSNKKTNIDIRLIASTNRDLKKEVQQKIFRADLYYRLNVMVSSVSPEVMKLFLEYSWPGNLRELENVIERAVVLSRGDIINLKGIPSEIKKGVKDTVSQESMKSLKEMEIETILNAVKAFNGNKSKAARTLGITRKVIYSRLQEHASQTASRK
ncbi:MAG: sigma-54-dependent Fis family transcriptional regulator, partial [Nitrospirae bacterium]|nr:sigma-54-dependent Fis family transcriptional regulator [Nitrospirota bacterium]